MTQIEILTITPDTRIGPLLDRYPELETPLLKLSPAYAKLRNPLLRKTVARVATLQQIATIGEVPIGSLINTLRSALGIEEKWTSGSDGEKDSHSVPDWFAQTKIAALLDAAPILEAGEHPLNRVMSDLQKLAPGEIYELLTPFVPAPLLDAVEKKGFEVWSQKQPDGTVRSYFCKRTFEV
jgi:hypothetical protein